MFVMEKAAYFLFSNDHIQITVNYYTAFSWVILLIHFISSLRLSDFHVNFLHGLM